MPPTHNFVFEEVMPFNNKWSWNPDTSDAASVDINVPEYVVDVLNTFYFTYDTNYLNVEDQFSQNTAAGGDPIRFTTQTEQFFWRIV